MIEIRRIRPEEASIAAALHVEGQPGTVLTTLGKEFLTALYAELDRSEHGLAFVAVSEGRVVGIIAGSTDTRALFRDLVWKRGLRLALPVARRLLRKPALLWRVLQTLAYPNKLRAKTGDAEFLFIGVSSEMRRQGIASRMLEVLIAACKERGATGLLSTVEASNPRANPFHVKWGFEIIGHLKLYGRPMNLYYLPLVASHPQEDPAGEG